MTLASLIEVYCERHDDGTVSIAAFVERIASHMSIALGAKIQAYFQSHATGSIQCIHYVVRFDKDCLYGVSWRKQALPFEIVNANNLERACVQSPHTTTFCELKRLRRTRDELQQQYNTLLLTIKK